MSDELNKETAPVEEQENTQNPRTETEAQEKDEQQSGETGKQPDEQETPAEDADKPLTRDELMDLIYAKDTEEAKVLDALKFFGEDEVDRSGLYPSQLSYEHMRIEESEILDPTKPFGEGETADETEPEVKE